MSIKVIPAVPAKRFRECDGCHKTVEAKDGLVMPFGWNRVSARDKDAPVQVPIYGDGDGCGFPPPDANSLHEFDYCDECSQKIVECMKRGDAGIFSSVSRADAAEEVIREQADALRGNDVDETNNATLHLMNFADRLRTHNPIALLKACRT